MPKKSLKDIQSKVVSEMIRRCNPKSAGPASINKAAKAIADMYDPQTYNIFYISSRQKSRQTKVRLAPLKALKSTTVHYSL